MTAPIFHAAYRSYAEAKTARVQARVPVLIVGDMAFERDATGTALTTQGGQNWSPFGRPALAHWGITGIAHGAASADRYMDTPTADETASIQAAFDWAVARGEWLSGDPRKVYGITAPVVFGARSGGPDVIDGSRVTDVNLKVIGGTWAAGSRAGLDDDAWTYGDAALVIGKALSAGGAGKPTIHAERCRVDAARIAPVAIQVTGTGAGSRHVGLKSERGAEAEMVAGYPGDSTGTDAIDSWTNTDAVFIACTGASYLFEERSDGSFGADDGTGWYGLTGRTSHGLVIRGSDQRFESCVFQTGLLCLMLGRGFDCQLNGCKFWAGETETDINSRTVHIGKRAEEYRFTGCTFQDGQVYIKGLLGAWNANTFGKFIHNQLRLVATDTSETATGFVFVGNRLDEDNALFVTEGAGSWSEFAGEVGLNNRTDGSALQFQGQIIVNGYFRVTTDGRVRAALIVPPANSAAPGLPGEFGFGTDSLLYWHDGSQWLRVSGGTF